MLQTQMHNYLTLLLCSPLARASYVVLFNLKPLIEDGNLLCACAKKSLRSPQNTIRKSHNFLEVCPHADPPHAIRISGPHFLFLPWVHTILSAALDKPLHSVAYLIATLKNTASVNLGWSVFIL